MLLTSREKRNEEAVSQLVELWQKVFGDDEEYIRLLVPYLDSSDCYAIKEDGRIVSAFYLLPSEIKIGSRYYKGGYLYAAATYEEYRKKGYMSSLIKEAIDSKKGEFDFISLVPANESLYSYYGRFGFEAKMYNYRTKILCNGTYESKTEKISDGAHINGLRKGCSRNIHLFSDEAMNYALSCYGFFGSFFENRGDGTVLYIEDEETVYEVLFGKNAAAEYLAYLSQSFNGEITAVTPYRLNEASEKIKCGMIYDFTGELKNIKEVYMNHTLI